MAASGDRLKLNQNISSPGVDAVIRPAAVSDVSRIAEIHVFGWRSAYRGIVSDDYLFRKMSVSQRLDPFRNAIESKEEETYVFEDCGIVKSFMTVGPCRDSEDFDHFEIWGVYVEPSFKRSGIGRKMMNWAESTAKSRGYGSCCLWVLQENNESIRFYESQGYAYDGKVQFVDFLNAGIVRMHKELTTFA